MVDVSAYAPPLSAVGAARTAPASAVNVATSYGERPSFRDDAVTASAATRAMSSKISRLNDVRALERVDGVLGVTLVATDAIVDVLTEMKTLVQPACRIRACQTTCERPSLMSTTSSCPVSMS